MDKRNVLIGSFFLIAALFCIITWLTKGYEPYFATGVVLFPLVAIAFFKRARPK
ncbi:MAG: hypothetical protein RR495_02550 [Anaerovoracaceae bacterium]